MVQQATSTDDRLISDSTVADLIDSSRSWPWKLYAAGKFPAPIKISPRCTRWRLSDVRAWMADPAAWMNKASTEAAPAQQETVSNEDEIASQRPARRRRASGRKVSREVGHE